eukprot:gene9519-6823_t
MACVHQQCVEAHRLSRRHAPDIGVLLRERVFAPDRSAGASPTGNGVTTLPLLATQEVCLRDGYVHELPTAGAHTVNVAIKSPYASLVGPEDKSTYNVALCFVPEPGLRDTIAHVVFPRPQTDGPRHRSAAATTAATAAVDHRDDDGDDVLALKQSRDGTQSLLGSASSDQNHLDHQPLTQGSRFRGKPSTSSSAGGPAYAYAARGSDVGADGVSPTSFASRLLEAWTAPWRHNIFTLRPTDAPLTRTGGPAAVGVAGDNAATDLEANATPAAAAGPATGSDTPTTPTLQQFPASAYPSQVAPAVVFSFPVPRHLPSLFATAASPTPPGAAPKPRVRRDIHPRDVITIDTRGRLYTSMEIFGLGALPHAEATATSTGADAAAAPASPPASMSPRSAVAAPAPAPPTATFLAPETLSNHPSRVTPMASPSTSLRHQSGEMALRDSDAVELSHIVGDRGTANPQQVRPAGPSAATVDDSNGTAAAASAAAAAAPTAAPAVSSLALAQGGAFSGEECVVCLTDPKEILLLPCRHLCVCASCFVFVDKCPVCRALSSEYVAIQSGTKVPFQPVRR